MCIIYLPTFFGIINFTYKRPGMTSFIRRSKFCSLAFKSLVMLLLCNKKIIDNPLSLSWTAKNRIPMPVFPGECLCSFRICLCILPHCTELKPYLKIRMSWINKAHMRFKEYFSKWKSANTSHFCEVGELASYWTRQLNLILQGISKLYGKEKKK